MPDSMVIEYAALDEISEDPANARRHSDANIEATKGSLRRFGQQKPIVVDRDGIVRAGNGTLRAARELGWGTIAIVRTDLDGPESTAYAIADNRTAELGEWDDQALALQLTSLSQELQEAAGFAADELRHRLQRARNVSFAARDLDVDLQTLWGVIVECDSEDQQRDLLARFDSEGLKVRAILA